MAFSRQRCRNFCQALEQFLDKPETKRELDPRKRLWLGIVLEFRPRVRNRLHEYVEERLQEEGNVAIGADEAPVGDGSVLDFLQWLIEHQDEIISFIEKLLALLELLG